MEVVFFYESVCVLVDTQKIVLVYFFDAKAILEDQTYRGQHHGQHHGQFHGTILPGAGVHHKNVLGLIGRKVLEINKSFRLIESPVHRPDRIPVAADRPTVIDQFLAFRSIHSTEN